MGDEGEQRVADPKFDWIKNTIRQNFIHINEQKFDKAYDTEEQM
jgi:hypothetical protein